MRTLSSLTRIVYQLLIVPWSEHEMMKNKIMSNTVDNLEQASRGANMFVTGLTDSQATKEGIH